jgi:hypothetical protein
LFTCCSILQSTARKDIKLTSQKTYALCDSSSVFARIPLTLTFKQAGCLAPVWLNDNVSTDDSLQDGAAGVGFPTYKFPRLPGESQATFMHKYACRSTSDCYFRILTKTWLCRHIVRYSRIYPQQRQRIFPLASVSRPALRPTQPPVQWVPGSFPRGKVRGERNADHLPSSSAEVKNE